MSVKNNIKGRYSCVSMAKMDTRTRHIVTLYVHLSCLQTQRSVSGYEVSNDCMIGNTELERKWKDAK
jgi:hypothetical protein